jgi:F-type H+-transporting ATPase subunit delta
MVSSDREKPKHDTVMDVTEERIARVYAVAFMEVAGQSANVDGLVDEVQSLVSDVLDREPRLEETFRSALVSLEDKLRLIDRSFSGRLSPQVVNFLKVLSQHGRLGLLRSIARIVRNLYTERIGIAEVEVRVATDLDDALRSEIEHRIQNALDKKPVLNVTIDPSLIAGIWVRVGDRVFDGSIRTQLEHARRRMIDLATEKIETQPERFVRATA